MANVNNYAHIRKIIYKFVENANGELLSLPFFHFLFFVFYTVESIVYIFDCLIFPFKLVVYNYDGCLKTRERKKKQTCWEDEIKIRPNDIWRHRHHFCSLFFTSFILWIDIQVYISITSHETFSFCWFPSFLFIIFLLSSFIIANLLNRMK